MVRLVFVLATALAILFAGGLAHARMAMQTDDKLFPVEALGFQPRASVGLVPAIGALRDDALDTVLAS